MRGTRLRRAVPPPRAPAHRPRRERSQRGGGDEAHQQKRPEAPGGQIAKGDEGRRREAQGEDGATGLEPVRDLSSYRRRHETDCSAGRKHETDRLRLEPAGAQKGRKERGMDAEAAIEESEQEEELRESSTENRAHRQYWFRCN